MNVEHYTYRVTWSAEDDEYVGLCAELPSLSWLAASPEEALVGIRSLAALVVDDMMKCGEEIPTPLAERNYSGEFRVRITSDLHRKLVIDAQEQQISLNRLVSAKLAA